MSARKSDVVVIGAGAVGLACAYFLARTGKKVHLLDAEAPGAGASSGNCGLITPSHALPLCGPGQFTQAMKAAANPSAPVYVKPQLSTDFVEWTARFAKNSTPERVAEITKARSRLLRASRKLTEKLIEQEGMECEWSTPGTLVVTRTEQGREEIFNTANTLGQMGVSVDLLKGEEAMQMEPALVQGVMAAALYEDDAVLKPELFVSELVRVCREWSVEFFDETPVASINLDGDKVHSVFTDRGLFETSDVVIAGGVGSAELAKSMGLKLPIIPGKGYSSTTRLPDPQPKHALIFEERRVAVTPWSKDYRLGGTMEFSGMDFTMNKKRIEAIQDAAAEFLVEPFPPGAPENWFGFRPMTPDDLPVIGPAPNAPRVFFATGHNMLGMSLAVITGRLIAELVNGKKPSIDVSPYRFGRFAEVSLNPLDGMMGKLKDKKWWPKRKG